MELRRAGEALLRSQPSTLLCSALAPSLRSCQRTQLSRSMSTSQTIASSRRTLATSAPRRQQAAAAAAAAPPPSNNTSTPQPTQQPRRTPPILDSDLTSAIDRSLDFTRRGLGPTQNRTSRFKSPSAQAETRGSSPYGSNPANKNSAAPSSSSSSADDVRDAFARSFAPVAPRRPGGNGTLDVSRMAMPGTGRSGSGGAGTGLEMGMGFDVPPSPPQVMEAPTPTLRLNPSTGRSVNVDNRNIDLARGLRMLDIMVAKNRVRADAARQRFHERPGLKRKRLGSERWRKRFRTGFQAVVRRVEEMRRKGW